jgi:AcrR family transcriptional regulator
MTQRGDRTRAKLIEATLAVVEEVGYAHASTRAIAEAAGVSEGTIYRHFPDKTSLFFAAALAPSTAVLDSISILPEQAGQRTLEENLTDALLRLAELQERVFPLEVAIAADPELAAHRRRLLASGGPLPGGVPEAIASYLAAEQGLGRIAADLEPPRVALVLLATLFGLALEASARGMQVTRGQVGSAVRLLVRGMTPSDRTQPRHRTR